MSCYILLFVYYESIKRELKIRPIYECRSDERLKTKPEESIRLGYTGLLGELEHLKIKTRLIDEMFASAMGEYVLLEYQLFGRLFVFVFCFFTFFFSGIFQKIQQLRSYTKRGGYTTGTDGQEEKCVVCD